MFVTRVLVLRRRSSLLVAVVTVAAALTTDLFAQSEPSYVDLSRFGAAQATKGVLYKPDSGVAPRVGVLIAQRIANFLDYLGCSELASRGFAVLCMNPRSDNNDASVIWEDNALDVKAGVAFLRSQPGIEKVVLWGFSAGGGTMSFYQAVAENGPAYCRGSEKLVECSDSLEGLPQADGIILVDSNPGAATTLIRLNGAVVNDEEIVNRNEAPKIESALDPFSPENGYSANGTSTYTAEFKERYFRAQSARMNRLIELAVAKRQQMEDHSARFPDDDVFVIYGASTALLGLDSSIHDRTALPRKLLKNDGTIVHQTVESMLLPQPRSAGNDVTFVRGALLLTVRSFLGTHAIKSRHSMDDIDWCSSNHSVPCALAAISAPVLVATMQASGLMRFNEMHYDFAKSKDKDFVVIEGATHGQTPCAPCEEEPGEFSNSTRNFFDYAASWISTRFSN